MTDLIQDPDDLQDTGALAIVAYLSIACVLSTIVAVSLPGLNNIDIARINYHGNQNNATGTHGIDQIRVSRSLDFLMH